MAEFCSFEQYLENLFSLQGQIAEQIENHSKLQRSQANNYERLAESFSQLKRVKGSSLGGKPMAKG